MVLEGIMNAAPPVEAASQEFATPRIEMTEPPATAVQDAALNPLPPDFRYAVLDLETRRSAQEVGGWLYFIFKIVI